EIALERSRGLDRMAELDVHAAEVVEDRVRRRDVVGALELGQRGVVATLVEQLDSAIEVDARPGPRFGIARLREARGGHERDERHQEERQRSRDDACAHGPYGFSSSPATSARV